MRSSTVRPQSAATDTGRRVAAEVVRHSPQFADYPAGLPSARALIASNSAWVIVPLSRSLELARAHHAGYLLWHVFGGLAELGIPLLLVLIIADAILSAGRGLGHKNPT